MNTEKQLNPVYLANWLFVCAGLVFAMVIVGAITRLTDSGLSMVEWRPLLGALPPLNTEEWERVFSLYQQSPEFEKKHFWMELDDFKMIFFWEWFHRLLGRMIGLAYGLPLLFFWVRGMIPAGYKPRLLAMLILGGLQGLMGWYMVKSGLVDQPAVSHYRLAAHLALALLIMTLLVWLGLSIRGQKDKSGKIPQALYIHGWAVLCVVLLTIFWGAYTAGLDAGLIYNDSFPKMGGSWLPPDLWHYHPFWINFFENHSGVQLAHRWLGMLSAISVFSLWLHALIKGQQCNSLHALFGMVFIQIGLGITTLLTQVSIPVAVAHQSGAVIVLMLLIITLHKLRSAQ